MSRSDEIPLASDEPATRENPVKVYMFSWTGSKGQRVGFGRYYKSLAGARRAAEKHRAAHPEKTGYEVVGRAYAGFAF